MYRWNMVVRDRDVRFKFGEHTEEREKENFTGCFKNQTLKDQNENMINPIRDAAFRLAKVLNIDLTSDFLIIEQGIWKLVAIYKCRMFEAKLENGQIVLQTGNDWNFTREQFAAMFEFLDILKEKHYFF